MRTLQTQAPCQRYGVCWSHTFVGSVVSAWRNGFYIDFLAITAEVFCHFPAAAVLAPMAPLIALVLVANWCMFNHSASAPWSLTEEPIPLHHLSPLYSPCDQERDHHGRTRGLDSH